MNGTEDMIVDHNMVVTQVFRRLGKRLDRPCITAKFDLRINHTSFHRPLLLYDVRSCAEYRPSAPVPPDPPPQDRAEALSHTTRFSSARERISGWIRVPNRSIPEMKSSKV